MPSLLRKQQSVVEAAGLKSLTLEFIGESTMDDETDIDHVDWDTSDYPDMNDD